MSTFSERIIRIIETNEIKQVDFAKKLNVTQAYVSKIIKNGSLPSERVIEDICQKFHVNKRWLETGEGEMSSPPTKEQEIANIAAKLFMAEENSIQMRVASFFANLSEDQWELVAQMAESVVKKKKQKKD